MAEAALASWDDVQHRLLDEPRIRHGRSLERRPGDHHARWSHRDGRRCAAPRRLRIHCHPGSQHGRTARPACAAVEWRVAETRIAPLVVRDAEQRSRKGVAVQFLEAADPRHGDRQPVHHDAAQRLDGDHRFHAPVHVRDRRGRSRRIRSANLIDRTVPGTAAPCGVREPYRDREAAGRRAPWLQDRAEGADRDRDHRRRAGFRSPRRRVTPFPGSGRYALAESRRPRRQIAGHPRAGSRIGRTAGRCHRHADEGQPARDGSHRRARRPVEATLAGRPEAIRRGAGAQPVPLRRSSVQRRSKMQRSPTTTRSIAPSWSLRTAAT